MKIPPHQYVFWAVGLWLEVALISVLLRGRWRNFPLVFAYAIALLLTTVVEVSTYTAAAAAVSGARKLIRTRAFYYWINDAILQLLLFAVVISLIRKALRSSGVLGASRVSTVRRWLIPGAVAIAALSLRVHYDPALHSGEWMTLVSRDLAFASAILALLLWSVLIVSRRKDRQLLMLSGGLGIEFAGGAIGHSLRGAAQQIGAATESFAGVNATGAAVTVGGILIPLASLFCLYVWWRAFCSPDAPARPAPLPARNGSELPARRPGNPGQPPPACARPRKRV